MQNKMKPQTLKGFYDYFADDMKIRNFIRDTFRNLAEKYGFEPLETPALEYSELILGQSGAEAEKLYYKFKDNGGRDVMLKYELMIPMCRAVAENINNIPMPYKRYQIQNVWRADNVQKGRCREFTQMDIDTLGSSSPFADAEILQFGLNFLKKLGFKKYQVRINSREIIQGIVDSLLLGQKNFESVYIAIDKLQKIGEENVKKELTDKGIESKKVDILLKTLKLESIEDIEKEISESEVGKKGIENVKEIISILKDSGIEDEYIKFDLSLARGLASYTGAVWEFEIIDGDVGSVSGGGRYDKAVSKYIGREVPATGTSFGLERLTEIIKDRGMLQESREKEDVLLIPLESKVLPYTMKVANKLRESDINSNIYPNIEKLKNSFKYADRKNYKWVMIIGEDEEQKDVVQLKNMETKEQLSLSINDAVKTISKK